MKTFKEILKEGFEDDITHKYSLSYDYRFRADIMNLRPKYVSKDKVRDLIKDMVDEKDVKGYHDASDKIIDVIRKEYDGGSHDRQDRDGNVVKQSPGFDKAAEELEAMIMGFEAMFLAWAAEKDREFKEYVKSL